MATLARSIGQPSLADVYALKLGGEVIGTTTDFVWRVLNLRRESPHAFVREFVPQQVLYRALIEALCITENHPTFCIGEPPLSSHEFWSTVAVSGVWVGKDIKDSDAILKSCADIRREAMRLRAFLSRDLTRNRMVAVRLFQ